jgi:uncharacterized protein with HEPN domain
VTGKSFSKRDSEQLSTIIRYCEDIRYFIDLYGSDEESFCENRSLQYGCVFPLLQIGEHVKRISSELKDERPEIDWKKIAGMRDFIAHNYADIDISRVRLTVLDKIPLLEKNADLS